MRNLLAYADDCLKTFEDIAKAKNEPRKGLLLGQETMQLVTKQYSVFQQEVNNLSEMQKYKNDYSQKTEIKDALIHCYEVSTKPLQELKIAITKLQSDEYGVKCQYCCINIPNTLDHYLPKSLFPELSVHPLNLYPSCGQCNTEKGNNWIDDEGIRSFINLYYDVLPETKFLFAKLDYDPNDLVPKVKFELINNGDIQGDLFATIINHFSNLNLLSKYANQSNGLISSYKKQLCKKARRLGIEGLREDLREQSESLKEIFGVNYWQASLVDALYESDQFIESCKE